MQTVDFFVKLSLSGLAMGLLMFGVARPAHADTWGVGAGVSGGPVLSLQLQPTSSHAWHGTIGYSDGALSLQIDHQRLWWPRFARWPVVRAGAYSGIGLAGHSAAASQGGQENYYGRIPLGIQTEFRTLHLQLFTELALTAGPIPRTDLSSTAAAGLRAVF